MRYLLSFSVLAAFLVAGCDKAKEGNAEVAQEAQVGGETDVAGESSLPTCPDEVELTGHLPCQCYNMVATDPNAQVPNCKSLVVCCPECQGLRCEDHKYYDVIDECSLLQDASQVEVQEEPAVEPAPEVADEPAPEPQPEVAPEAAEEAVSEAAEEVWIHPCPYEVKLNAYTPCMCGDILVEDVESAYPGCTKKVVCCPAGGVKCE